ncbi:hypothetical protein BC938DRAFT_476755, partial [Jimgerdemannia flammicorona]
MSEARVHAKAKKARQDDLEALQITFYEIEAWIEKTQPVLKRMTGELDKASVHFDQLRPKPAAAAPQPQLPPSSVPLSPPVTPPNTTSFRPPPVPHVTAGLSSQPISIPMSIHNPQSINTRQMCLRNDSLTVGSAHKPVSWVFSFNPTGGLKLETNITSVDQLVDAVDKFSLLVHPGGFASINPRNTREESPQSPNSQQPDVDTSVEYWGKALDMNPCTPHRNSPIPSPCTATTTSLLSPVTDAGITVPRDMLERICQVYWDCLHPKICVDWRTFWNRYPNPTRNLLCVNSGLALAFIHFIRHDSKSCPNAKEVGMQYFERTRTLLADCFDTPDLATVEALMNLGMFQVLQKYGSQARLYIGFAIRMALRIGMHRRENLPTDPAERKHHLRVFMVMYYYDCFVSTYAMQPPLLDDAD